MDIWVCDCCGKQIDRFVSSHKYEIRKTCRDREDRAFYLRPLKFCTSCQHSIEEMLERRLRDMPERVEVSLYREE